MIHSSDELVANPPNLGGRPLTVVDPEVLTTLTEARMIEQIAWKDLVHRYSELTGKTIDWRTLRDLIMRDSGSLAMPSRVSKRMKVAIEEAFDKVDLAKLVMHALTARFQEWGVLNERRLRSMVAAGNGDDDAESKQVVRFSEREQYRMDLLWNDIMGFFFKGVTLMKDMKAQETSLWDSLAGIFGAGAAEAASELGSGGISSAELSIQIKQRVEQAGQDTMKMLETVNEQHKASARGHFRALAEPDEDLLDIDS